MPCAECRRISGDGGAEERADRGDIGGLCEKPFMAYEPGERDSVYSILGD